MKSNNCNPNLRDGDEIQNEWSQVAYDLWCREQAQEFETVHNLRVVNLYNVIRSVIENDFSPVEKSVARLHWFNSVSVSDIATLTNLSRTAVYKALDRGKEKLHVVLKHLIDCEEYRIPK